MHCTSTSGKIPAYSPENAILGIPHSQERNCVATGKYEVHSGGSKPWPYTLQGGLTSKPSKTWVHIRGEGGDQKVWCQKQPRQGCWTLLSDFRWQAAMSLTLIVVVTFLLRDWIAKLKFENTMFWMKSSNLMPAKFSCYTVVIHTKVVPTLR